MNFFCGYWVVGCLIVGLAWGSFAQRCPNDEMDLKETIGTVAIWPVAFGMVFTAPKPKPAQCKVAP